MPAVSEMVAELHGDIAPFRKSMGEAVTVSETTSQRIGRELQRVEEHFGSIREGARSVSGALSALSRVFAGGALLAGGFKIVSDTLEGLAQIGRNADAVGLTTDQFQELAYAMGRAGVSSESQAKLLTVFSERSADAGRETGKLFEALEKYNPEALTALRNTGEITSQLGAFAEAVRTAGGEQERAALMTAAFGEANSDLRRFLIGGASGIDASIMKAREFGVVIDEELVRKAPEIQEQFRAVAAVIGVQFQNSMITAAPVVVDFAQNIADLVEYLVPAIDGFNRLTVEISAFFSSTELGTNSVNTLNIKLRDTLAEIDAIQGRVNSSDHGIWYSLFGDRQGDHDRMMELVAQAKTLQDEIAKRGWKGSFEVTPSFRQPVAAAAAEDPAAAGPAPGVARAMGELQRIEDEYLKASKRTTDLIQVEYDRQLAGLQRNLDEGLIAAGDYTKARAELEGTLTAKLAAEAQKQIEPISRAISGTLTRAFDDFIETGDMNFKRLAASMIAELAKVQFQMAVIQPLFGGGQTQGGGILGSALAGVFHGGGTVGAGGGVRSVPGLAFAMAPRFHNGGMPGLRAGEVPAILEKGETVLPKGQRGSGARPIVVNIQTPDIESFRRSEGQVAAMLSRAVSAGRRNM
ncbi:MAG: phage tail tape measure C-terminal domain-containing protein [Pseudomonadota bacterium]|nr:phage tail tape measure C-terminal domain-containing protein [Pseudomonadota bacterium]